MKNIINIDCNNSTYNSTFNSADNINELHLAIKPLDTCISNLKIEITAVNSDIFTYAVVLQEKVVSYLIPYEFYSKKGIMKIRLLSDEGNSEYYNFLNVNDLNGNENIFCKKIDNDFKILIATENSTGVPIATEVDLGVIKVGSTLNVKTDGTLNANEGEGIESITNTELEAMLI